MRKAMILMTVAALMVALMAGTAAAKQNGKGQGNSGKAPALVTYNFKGTVEEVSEGGTSITVDVTDGNKAARAHLGSQTFNVTSETKINVDDQEGAALEEIGEGYSVVVQSKAEKNATSFDARVISAEAPEVEEESAA
jgi:uncharacterized protein YjdB